MDNQLDEWIFRYNSHTKKWECTTRDNYSQLFSGGKGNVLRSNSMDTLVSLIIKTEGNIDKIDKLL